jgi:hypothetical protein
VLLAVGRIIDDRHGSDARDFGMGNVVRVDNGGVGDRERMVDGVEVNALNPRSFRGRQLRYLPRTAQGLIVL